jgi:hypothetical protein
MLVPPTRRSVAFSTAFDTAVQLCVEAQQTIARSAEILARARSRRTVRWQRRRIARDASAHLATTGALFDLLQREVERTADQLRNVGVDEEETLDIVRARVRFVLYDSAFAQEAAEPVVERVEDWVRKRFRAA